MNHWGNTSPATFVQLRKEADPVKTEAKLRISFTGTRKKVKVLY
ncbi:MAG: hypothetical protein WDO16_02640 [Bacteroidota bacterium]